MSRPGDAGSGVGGAAPAADSPARPLSRLRGLLGVASTYWLGHALFSGLALLLLPVLTRHLTPADYGMVAMFGLVAALAEPVLSLGVPAAAMRRYFDLQRAELAEYVGTCLLMLLPVTFVASLLAILLAAPLRALTFLPLVWILLALVAVPFNATTNLTLGLLQSMGRPVAHTVLSFLRALGAMGGSLLLVVVLSWGWEGRLEGILLGTLLAFPAAALVLWRMRLARLGWNPVHARHALRFGIPLMPHALGGVAMVVTDRLMLAHLVDVSNLGLYSVGFQVGQVVYMLQDGINKAWVPWLFARLGQADHAERVRLVRITYLYDVALIGGAVLFGLLAPYALDLLVPGSYAGAGPYVLWIALAGAFDGAYKMSGNYIFYAEKTHYLALVTFAAALLNIPLTWLLIGISGPIGAAQATAAVSFLFWLATWALSARAYPMPWLSALRAARSA